MYRSKHVVSLLAVVSFLFLAFSIAGVQASWRFAERPPQPESENLHIALRQWSGSEVLPEDSAMGENHLLLVENIVNGDGIGLNSKNSYLNDQIDYRLDRNPSRDTLGSMAVTQGSELDRLFGTHGEAENLTFIVHVVNSTTYEIFTTSLYLGERGEMSGLIFPSNKKPGDPTVPLGEYLYPVYKTTVVKSNGTWKASETALGIAKSAWYDESRSNSNKNVTQIPSINVDSWTSDLSLVGTGYSNAIWTCENQRLLAICGDYNTVTYFRIKPEKAGTLTVASEHSASHLEIHNANGTVLASGSKSASAAVSAETVYYITIKGAVQLSFTATVN